MPRTIRAVSARRKPIRVVRSQLASGPPGGQIGNVETPQPIGEKSSEVFNIRSLKSNTGKKETRPEENRSPSTTKDTIFERKGHPTQEGEASSDKKYSFLGKEPRSLHGADVFNPLRRLKLSENTARRPSPALPNVGGNDLDSMVTSPFFSPRVGGLDKKNTNNNSKTPGTLREKDGTRNGVDSTLNPPPVSHALGGVGGKSDSDSKPPKVLKPKKSEKASQLAENLKGRLAGRRCLVTGATSGIGYAIAKRFLEEGAASVISISRTQKNISAAYRRMKQELKRKKPPLYFVKGDITNSAFYKVTIKEHEKLADIDILVNAAGIGQACPLQATSWESSQQIMNTNLNATIALCKVFYHLQLRRAQILKRQVQSGTPEMPSSDLIDAGNESSADLKPMSPPLPEVRTRASPCIINVSSLLGVKGGMGATSYAASKAGVLGFTRALVCEHQTVLRHIRVNAIVPGYIDTPMTEAIKSSIRENLRNQIPLERFGTPAEVADAAVFLATNRYANNCVLNLDGGLSAM